MKCICVRVMFVCLMYNYCHCRIWFILEKKQESLSRYTVRLLWKSCKKKNVKLSRYFMKVGGFTVIVSPVFLTVICLFFVYSYLSFLLFIFYYY